MLIFKLLVFALGTLLIVWVSRHNLLQVRQHGFYRFLAWEMILIAFVLNVDYWFVDPLSPTQLAAWILLVVSLVFIVIAVRAFQRMGDIDDDRSDPGLVGVEKTTQLVTTGIYRYIRHPFYASLLFLCWGIFFKHVTYISSLLVLLATIFLFITAKIEEGENEGFFGQAYRDYMATTKMFIPFLF
jgi:protein-S-isoprenylcysteine O-methyltransferase Ste14